MSAVKTIEIKCSNLQCGEWFDSPIFFGDLNSFDTSTLEGNIVQCPKCHTMVGCNKENMKVRSNDGGFSGTDTV